ncbi:hypothetical protein [Burkholderia gladioli]|uniref:hypothetical protein n=1 Tax=Burkholderia gladioli TaxID=28095 RepID=UPI00163EA2A9|nr:hypothetical protein [Burkholderia gladioli]
MDAWYKMLRVLVMSVLFFSQPLKAESFADCGGNCYNGSAGIVKQEFQYECQADWNETCGSGTSGNFKACVPEGYKICGYQTEIITQNHNGQYGMAGVDGRCAMGGLKSSGSHNIFDRWGADIVVRLTLYSHAVDYSPSYQESESYCKIMRAANPGVKNDCSCFGEVMLCDGQPAGICTSAKGF